MLEKQFGVGQYGQNFRQELGNGVQRKKLVPQVARERGLGARDRETSTPGNARSEHH
jgi:hypothetical protein